MKLPKVKILDKRNLPLKKFLLSHKFLIRTKKNSLRNFFSKSTDVTCLEIFSVKQSSVGKISVKPKILVKKISVKNYTIKFKAKQKFLAKKKLGQKNKNKNIFGKKM